MVLLNRPKIVYMQISGVTLHQARAKLLRFMMPFIFPIFEWNTGINLLSLLCVGKLRLREATETPNYGERAKQGQSEETHTDGVDRLSLTFGGCTLVRWALETPWWGILEADPCKINFSDLTFKHAPPTPSLVPLY